MRFLQQTAIFEASFIVEESLRELTSLELDGLDLSHLVVDDRRGLEPRNL